MATSAIDLSSGLVPKQSNIDLSAGFVPRDQTEPSHWYTGVGDTLGREVSSMGSNMAGIPGGIYHAFADDPTQEETQEAGGPQEVSGAKRIGLGVGRLTAQPLVNAVRWYRDAAQGKVPDPVGQALSVAPEAMGTGAAAVVVPKVAESIPGAVSAAGPSIVRGLAKGTNKALAAAPGVVGGAAGHAVAGWPGAAVGYALGKEVLPTLKVPGENFGRVPLVERMRSAPAMAPEPLGPPTPDPALLQGRALSSAETRAAAPASQTGEALGQVTPNPTFSKTPLGPDAPSPDWLAYNKIRAQGLKPGGLRQAVSVRPAASPSEALGQISPPAVFPKTRLGPEAPPPEVGQARGLGGYTPPDSPASSLGKIPRPKLVDQIMERTTEAEPYPRLVDQIRPKVSPEISRPVTENPVVGSLVRAMQKSGLPIAERPNLLLKGSGRVNRILGPEEELTGPLEKSLRRAKRQREQ